MILLKNNNRIMENKKDKIKQIKKQIKEQIKEQIANNKIEIYVNFNTCSKLLKLNFLKT